MSRTVTVEFVLTKEIEILDDAMRLLAESGRPILLETSLEGRPTQGVLIAYEAYQELLRRLEDLEDLQAMHEAETEYRAGEGRPFSDIVAELEAGKEADVSG